MPTIKIKWGTIVSGVLVLIVVCLGIILIFRLVIPVQPPTTGEVKNNWDGKIAFVSGVGQDRDIYFINSDGSNRTRISDIGYVSWSSSEIQWSPDGTLVSFVSGKGNNCDQIYVINADGSGLRQLTNNNSLKEYPTWSPDSKRLVFCDRDRVKNSCNIFVINSDGSNLTKLTNTNDDHNPVWSPDGEHIAFRSDRDRTWGKLWLMNPDGTNQRSLTDIGSIACGAARFQWSPDATRLFFMRTDHEKWWHLDPNELDIYVINADGSNMRKLTDDPLDELATSWSPDSRRILFTRGDKGIYIMNSDGSNQTKLIDGAFMAAEWSPDGNKIVFRSFGDGDANIYVADSDGSNMLELTNDSMDNTDPHWLPIKKP